MPRYKAFDQMAATRPIATKRSIDDRPDGRAQKRKREDEWPADGDLFCTTMEILPMELLLMIFGKLECLDLVHCQAVCKRWRSTIPGEQDLRKAMFLENREEPVTLISQASIYFRLKPYNDDGSKNWIPQYVCYLDETLSFLPSREGHQLDPSGGMIYYHPVVKDLGRFLHLVNPNFLSVAELGDTSQPLRPAILFSDDADWKQQARRWKRTRSERWMKMYLLTPPVKSFTVGIGRVDMKTYPLKVCRQRNISNPLGVTVGQFIQAIQRYLYDLSYSNIGIE
ncbi:hypothetical protein BDV96DRAFT_641392 [Lophiotrema nucula]|uniref:F-box domain-containing protein n=1 Tax=Lophiotrema nucula TaxID=690887 RepID=A0A6A5ZNZ5_9PLEO|nr:hypothetical protein BDV96DRAFT_641392 [Lophiotrema nucula]